MRPLYFLYLSHTTPSIQSAGYIFSRKTMKLEIPPSTTNNIGGAVGGSGSKSFDATSCVDDGPTMEVVASSSMMVAKDDSSLMIGNLKAEYCKLEEEKDRLKKEWESMQKLSDSVYTTPAPIMRIPSTSSSEPTQSTHIRQDEGKNTNNPDDAEEDEDLQIVESRDELMPQDKHGTSDVERDDQSSATPYQESRMTDNYSAASSPYSPPPITWANHVRSDTTSSSSWSNNSIISTPSRASQEENLPPYSPQQQQQYEPQEQYYHQQQQQQQEEEVLQHCPIYTKQQSTASNSSSSSEESMIEQLRSMNQRLEQEKTKIQREWETMSGSYDHQMRMARRLPAPPSVEKNNNHQRATSDSSSGEEDFIDAIEFPSSHMMKLYHRHQNDDDFEDCNAPADATVNSRLTEDGAFLASVPLDDDEDILSAAEVFDELVHRIPPHAATATEGADDEGMMKPIERTSVGSGISTREVWLENAMVEWKKRAESAMNELRANKIIAKDRADSVGTKYHMDRLRLLEAENMELREIHEEMRATMKTWSDKQRHSVDALMMQLQEGGQRESMLLQQLGDAKAQAEGAQFRLDEFKKRNKTMDGVLVSHQNDIVTARKQVAILEDENKELRDVNKVQTEMMEMLTQLRDALQHQVHDQGKTVDSIRLHLNNHETRETELRTELEKAKMEIQSCQIQLNAAKMNKLEMLDKFSVLERTTDAANQRIKDIERENEDLRNVTVQVEEAMMAQADEEEQKLRALKNQLDDTANREALLRKTLGKAKDASELLRKEMQTVEQRNQQIAKTLSTTREELKFEQQQTNILRRELEQLRIMNKELDAEKARCEKEMKRSQEELAKTQNQVDEMSKQAKEAEIFHEKACKSLEEELSLIKNELSEKQDELVKATLNIAQLHGEIGTLQHSLKMMEERSKRAEEEAARFCSPLFALSATKQFIS